MSEENGDPGKNQGGVAFPSVGEDGNWHPHHDGMTVRQYYKAQSIQAADAIVPAGATQKAFDILAKFDGQIADAMIKEDEKYGNS